MMRFYWEGYAEVLQLVTTMRCLPQAANDRQSGFASRSQPAGVLHRLWRSLNALVRRQPSP